ncbi:hypothetical protein ACS0TY_034258 [Phlomoides rotata]
MDGGAPNNPPTVEDVFREFKGRRNALIRALTTDCDPEKKNLCLYGFPTEQWEVNLPAEEVPPELPEPALGINFARDGMQEKDWLDLVAVHSVSWLFSVAFYFGSRFGFDKADRKHLFNLGKMVNVHQGNEGLDEEEDKHGDTLCGACGENYGSDEFLDLL